ncbi:DnaD domain-containing protein [Gracilibacillus salinarum]|uniref:DnaD domain-containing protein n=1 Tax=Gracilibacillus salinarum TaxID=2932255 RepID=UPI002107FCD9|nr:DnaD domain protein [Gracilibacillus salinarum]
MSESPFNYELLTQWYEEYGYELLSKAMELAAKAEAKGVKYLESVLLNWSRMAVKTVEDASPLEQQRKARQRKPANQTNWSTAKRDIVPDWYMKQKSQPVKQKTETEEEKRRKAAEADRMLEEYLKKGEE